MKKTIMVSNSWRPEKSSICAKCGAEIEYGWGDYSFRYYERKDKSDICVICKACASGMKNEDKKIRVVNRAPIMDMINLRNSAWKPQPGMGEFASPSNRTETDPSDDEDADKG